MMLALGIFQALLDAMGAVLAWIYGFIGNYGVSIVVLTVLIKVVLLPLGIKQIKSMQSMQAIQPKVKEIQKKYKGNKQRVQEETMKLYKDAGVNPLGGCVPLLLQFPILIAMYAVIRPPVLVPATVDQQTVYEAHNNHLPVDSQLFQNTVLHEHLDFLGMNLQCSPRQSGTQAVEYSTDRKPVTPDTPIVNDDGKPFSFNPTTGDGKIDCGSGTAAKIPFYVFLAAMVATTYYQQRQMQRASPPGAATGQQQAIMKIFPLFFGFIGFSLPAGLAVYWTVSNLWQIGQQYALLKLGHIGPDAMERRLAEQREKGAKGPQKPGLMARMQDRAEAERKRREQPSRKPNPKAKPSGTSGRGSVKGGSANPKGGGSDTSKGGGPRPKRRRPNTGQRPPARRPDTDGKNPGAGGNGGTGDGEAGG